MKEISWLCLLVTQSRSKKLFKRSIYYIILCLITKEKKYCTFKNHAGKYVFFVGDCLLRQMKHTS